MNWKNCFKASLNSANRAVCARTDNLHNLVLLIYTWLPDSSGDIMVIKLDPAGNMMWQRFYDGPNHTDDVPIDMVVDRYNNIWICGTTRTRNSDTDILLIKFTDEGVLGVNEAFGLHDSLSDVPVSIAADRTGCPVIAGAIAHPDYGTEHAILRYNIEGKLVWYRTISTPKDDSANDLAIDDSCNIYVTGTINNGDKGTDLIIAKYDSIGNEKWRYPFNGIKSVDDAGTNIALDDSVNVFVSGYSNRTDGHSDLPILKFNRGGQLIMEASYFGNTDECMARQLMLFKNSALLVADYTVPDQEEKGCIHYQFAMNGGRIVFEKKFPFGAYYHRVFNDKNFKLLVGARMFEDAGTLQPQFSVIDKEIGARFQWTDERVLGLAHIRDVVVDEKRAYFFGDDAAASSGTTCIYSYSIDPVALDALLKKTFLPGANK